MLIWNKAYGQGTNGMELQIALDDIILENAFSLIEKVYAYIDIIEIGTPMVMEYGMTSVREMKRRFPEKKILADLKIMDAGYFEAEIALKAGADFITVLGVTDDRTISGCVEAARKYGGSVVADTIGIKNLEERIARLEEAGVGYISVHTGVDQQAADRTPLDDLKVIKAAVKRAGISVAGGISANTLSQYLEYEPEIIVVGSGIVSAEYPDKEARKIHELLL